MAATADDNEAAVTGTRYTGGVVAQNHTGTTSKNTTVGTVTNCYNRGTIKGSTVGGVVGVNGNNYGNRYSLKLLLPFNIFSRWYRRQRCDGAGGMEKRSSV